jgi:hypothetical protein
VSLILAKGGNRALRAVMRTLNGAAPGATAVAQYTRIRAGTPLTQENGGVRPVETVVVYNAATTASDANAVNSLVFDQVVNRAPATYPDSGVNNRMVIIAR